MVYRRFGLVCRFDVVSSNILRLTQAKLPTAADLQMLCSDSQALNSKRTPVAGT